MHGHAAVRTRCRLSFVTAGHRISRTSGRPERPRRGFHGGVLTLRLAAGATTDTRGALRTVLAHTSGGALSVPVLNSSTGVRLGPCERSLAIELLDADRAAVRSRLAAHWDGLTTAATGIDSAASLLGMPSPPEVSAMEQGLCG